MFETHYNNIADQTSFNDQLDILKEYINYRVTFHVERIYNRLRVAESMNWFPGKLEVATDSAPVDFAVLKKAYDEGLSKTGVIKAIHMGTKVLDDDIKKLMNIS
jgi:hypothetical protein